jgi:hypothetical protein
VEQINLGLRTSVEAEVKIRGRWMRVNDIDVREARLAFALATVKWGGARTTACASDAYSPPNA